MLDPVHKWIDIDPICLKVIDTPLFQRLGYVRQLTSAQYVFPSAHHTRKEHCIGAMHIADKYISSITEKTKFAISPETKQNLKLSALLHDVGHGFFSHSFDAVIYAKIYPDEHKGHDIHRFKLIEYFHGIFDIEAVKDIWNEKEKHLSALIQGPLSVDRMDFTKRDSFFTGVNYGIFDIDRIVKNAWFEEVGDKPVLVYNSKIVKSALQGLSTRIYMYEEIYLNKIVVAASVLIDCMMLEALKHIDYISKVQDVEQFIYLTDYSLFYDIISSTSEELKEAKKYAKRLYERKLPKLIHEQKKYGKAHSGVTILENGDIKWVSRNLSRNFIQEFEKYDIYIRKKEQLFTFRDYCTEEKIEENKEEIYYFERIYRL